MTDTEAIDILMSESRPFYPDERLAWHQLIRSDIILMLPPWFIREATYLIGLGIIQVGK